MNPDAVVPNQPAVEPLVLRGRYTSATLFCGDCTKIELPHADAVVTDPPYGREYAANPLPVMHRTGRIVPHASQGWDVPAESVLALPDSAPLVVIWGGNYYALPPRRGWLVWYKPDAPPSMASVELAWTNRDQNARMITRSIAATNAERVGHPTQKPVRVMSWCMDEVGVPEGATVLDPYMGSGTTGVACARTKRHFIGVEIDPNHFANAVRRITFEIDQQLI